MLILAVDTSGKQGSIALARGDAASFELIESVPVAGGTFSAQLIPAIAALLGRQKIPKEKLDGFAAASGPGSFTGLRVGLAAVKGLAETLRKPIAAVSVLEACAHVQRESMNENKVLVALDASRGDIFLGRFTFNEVERRLDCLEESLASREESVQYLREHAQPSVCSPDESVIAFLGDHGVAVAQIQRPGSPEIACLGVRKIAAGEVVTPEALDANYIRRAEFTKMGAR
jgi:tRNA threonylcarbamoyladenosine biosynthesis protein TsaB